MGRVKRSAEEEVDNLNLRVSETLAAARRRKLILCMKNRPNGINGLWEKLVSMGYTDGMIVTPGAVETPKSARAAAVEERKKKKAEEIVAKADREQHSTSTTTTAPTMAPHCRPTPSHRKRVTSQTFLCKSCGTDCFHPSRGTRSAPRI